MYSSLRYSYSILLTVIVLLCSQNIFAQNQSDLDGLVSKVNSVNEKLPKEFLHLHVDRPYYNLGDTLWFKVYLLKEHDFVGAESGIVYVEVVREDGVVAKRVKVHVEGGLTWGQVPLTADEFEQGAHVLRTYSKYQLNFGKEKVYTYPFYVGAARANKIELAKNKATAKASDSKEDVALNTVNQALNYDVQFLPEGGNLVNGLQSNVAVKAVGSSGKGVKVSGDIYNSKGDEVASFITNDLGVGVISLQPEANEVYTAKIKQGDRVVGEYQLPKVQEEGTAIMVINRKGYNKIDVYIQGTKNKVGKYFLVARSRGVVGYAAIVELDNRLLSKLSIPKDGFATGIIQVSLLDINKRPLNERLAFVDHDDELKINIVSHKESYSKKDSVSLNILVTNKDNQPVEASLSIAVTDEGQVKIDSNGRSIRSDFLLASQLLGEVENPGHYLSDSESAWSDLDLLLLSQGWTGYRWEEFPAIDKELEYPLEKGLEVKGRVVNGVGKPQEGRDVVLVSSNPVLSKTTATDKSGRFMFDEFPPMETVAFVVQSTNSKGKRFNVGVEVDEFDFPVFDVDKKKFEEIDKAEYAELSSAIDPRDPEDEAYNVFDEGVALKAVEVIGKKIVKGSRNLNGDGNSDQALNEKDLLLENNKSLLDLLKEKIKGFQFDPNLMWFKINDRPIKFIFDGVNYSGLGMGQLNNDPLDAIMEMSKQSPTSRVFEYSEDSGQIVATGYADAKTNTRAKLRTFLDQTLNFRQDNYYEIEGVLNGYRANDLKGVEILYNDKYNQKYNQVHAEFPNDPFAYIEITTRAGTGAKRKSVPGIYYFRPMPFSWPKDFYSPKYKTATKQELKDRRPTLFWAPSIITDETGKAQVSFYTSDMPGTYQIKVEGADMKGLIGESTQKVLVEE